MGKRRHEEVQTTSSNVALIAMGAAGIAVAALVIWALTRTVQTTPSTTAEVPAVAETAPATNTLPPLDTGGFSTTPANVPPVQTSTYTPNPPTTDENASVKRMSVTDLRSKIDTKQVTVIDVRDKTSFIASHIPGSLHVPMATVESQVTFLPKDKPIVTYCT